VNLAYSRLKKIFKKFNEREFTYEDFLKISRRKRISIYSYSMNENVRGYYSTNLRRVYRKKCIVFNDCLSETERLYVAYHELAHHFLHVTLTTQQTFYCKAFELTEAKHDTEADTIALIMVIPQKTLFAMHDTPFEDINPFLREKLIKRQQIFHDFGV